MREYLMQDWILVMGLVLVLVLSILCQLVMIYNMKKLIKEGEGLTTSKEENSHVRSVESGVAIPCKKVAIPAFYML